MPSVVERQQIALSTIHPKGLGWIPAFGFGILVFRGVDCQPHKNGPPAWFRRGRAEDRNPDKEHATHAHSPIRAPRPSWPLSPDLPHRWNELSSQARRRRAQRL